MLLSADIAVARGTTAGQVSGTREMHQITDIFISGYFPVNVFLTSSALVL